MAGIARGSSLPPVRRAKLRGVKRIMDTVNLTVLTAAHGAAVGASDR